MKSLDTIVFAVLGGILKDAAGACPSYLDSHYDLMRVKALYESRGLSSMMIDLPSLRNLLLAGLESGRLELEGPLSRRVSKTTLVPSFLKGLWLRIFHKNGSLRSDACPNAILYIGQITCFVKSLKFKCSDDRINATVGDYYDIESELRSPTLNWGGNQLYTSDSIRAIHFRDGMDGPTAPLSNDGGENGSIGDLVDRLQRVCDSVSGYLGFFDPYSFTNGCGYSVTRGRTLSHGRGSVSDQRRSDNRYQFPNWSERLQAFFPYDAFASHNFNVEKLVHGDVPSKLIAVPKDLTKPRLIASEPTSNQWAQQITMRWLVERVGLTPLSQFIDFKRQDLSQRLVTESSLSQLLATVDLSSASDRLSCWSIERCFRKNPVLLDILNSHRTPFIKDGITGRDVIFQKKFASQGTAVTFPVQTIFFLCCVLAALGVDRMSDAKRHLGKVRVYGDDIIIPRTGLENLKRLLDFLQLKVNVRKTFSKGHFRESCGLDSFKGYNVTPVKPKTLEVRGPESLQAVLDTVNNLFCEGHWHASEALLKTIPKKFKFPVVVVSAQIDGLGRLVEKSTGLLSYCGYKISHLKQRWNPTLHRTEFQCSRFISTRTVNKAVDSSPYFQFLAENPSNETQWESGYSGESRLKIKRGWESLEVGL